MARPSWKIPFFSSHLDPMPKGTPHTRERSSMIIKPWIGSTFMVHNGKSFLPVRIAQPMLGTRLGQYCIPPKRRKNGTAR